MLFHAVRFVEQFEMSSTVKFVYVRFMGQEVKPTAKGRYGVVSGSVESHFQVCGGGGVWLRWGGGGVWV